MTVSELKIMKDRLEEIEKKLGDYYFIDEYVLTTKLFNGTKHVTIAEARDYLLSEDDALIGIKELEKALIIYVDYKLAGFRVGEHAPKIVLIEGIGEKSIETEFKEFETKERILNLNIKCDMKSVSYEMKLSINY